MKASFHRSEHDVRLGLRKGDRLAILGPNMSEVLISYYAGALTGLILSPLIFEDIDPIKIVGELQPPALVVHDSPECLKIIQDVFTDASSFEKGKFESDKFPKLKKIIFSQKECKKDVWTFEERTSSYLHPAQHEFPEIEADDIFAVILTV